MIRNLFRTVWQKKPRRIVRPRRRSSVTPTVRRLAEMLEKRFAMSVNTVFSVGGGADPWTTVVTDYGSDAYLQHIGDSAQSLLISNNASFRGTSLIAGGLFQDQVVGVTGFNQSYDTLRVYEGEAIQIAGPLRSTAHPDYNWNDDLTFVLPSYYIDTTTTHRMSGTLTVNGRDWRIDQIGNSPSDRLGIRLQSGVDTLDITANFGFEPGGLTYAQFENVVTALGVGVGGDVSLDLQYDPDVSIGALDPDLVVENFATGVLPAVNGRMEIKLVDLSDGQQLIPGATRGRAQLSMTGGTISVEFVASPEPTSAGANTFDIFFSTSGLANRVAALRPTARVYDNNGFDPSFSGKQITGVLNAATGVVTLNVNGYFGFEVSEVQTALYDRAKAEATEVTLYAGFEHEVGLEISLPSPNSRIQIDSRVDIDGPRVAGIAVDRHKIELAASTIEINAPVRSYQGFVVDLDVDAPLGVATEEVIINGMLTTPTADIYLTDRADTSTPSRSKLRISATGAITNDDDYFDTGGVNTVGNPTLADRVYVSAETGDIIIDGEIAAVQHTYVMQSAGDDNSRFKAPFVLSTGSFADGVGQIIGNDVVVSLGNDIYGSQLVTTAFSRVSIDTDVDRLRVRAGSRRGDVSGVPFPYELSVREEGDLVIDAMASSSRSLDIFAGGDLTVSGAIRSGGDLSLTSDLRVSGRAPIETSFGTIDIEAPQVNLVGAVRVLDTIPDERRSDIVIRATGPNFADPNTGALRQSLEVGDRITAVNNVELASDLGSVSGRGIVVADTLLATAAENIILHTDVHRAKVEIETPVLGVPGRTGIIALYEEDYIAVDARNARTVVLSAQGDDAFLQDPSESGSEVPYQLSSALIARVSDAQVLFVSAPSGSIDASVYASTDVQLGNLDAADSAAIMQTNPLFQLDTMLAAGSVSIVGEDAQSIKLFDAPNALSGAINARFATQKVITSTRSNGSGGLEPDEVYWSAGQPGFDRAELEFTLPVKEVMRLVGYLGDGQDRELAENELDNWNQNFRESDIILVKDGAILEENGEVDKSINGIYQVAERSYKNASGSGETLMTIRLVRLQSRDQTSEVSRTHYVKVAEFEDTPASEWVSWRGVASVGPGDVRGEGEKYTNIAVREIDSQTGFTPVMAVTTLPIEGSYEEPTSSHYGKITSRIQEDIKEASELFGGVELEEGDLVLVQFGTDQDQNPGALTSARTNGIYKVVESGRNQNAFGLNGIQWELERYQGVDENGDGEIDAVFTGVAAVNQGRLRTSLTGKMFEYSYDAINTGAIEYTRISNGLFLEDDGIPRYEYYQTSVGSALEGAQIELTVTAASGGNNDGGTMGRMLNLLQQNKTDRPMLLSFDTNLIRQDGDGSQAVVSLTEELPAITRSVAINGNNVMVDGSGIIADEFGQELRGLSDGRYFGPVRPSEVALARRQVLTRAPDVGSTAGNGKNGLEFGANADGSIVRNLRIGGFDEGSAVFIQGADNILLENMVVGGGATEFAAIGKRLTNMYGVTVAGFGDKTGYGVTLRDVAVNDATAVGINLETGTQGVRILESTVGSEGYRNEIGIRVGDVLAENEDTPAGEYLHQVIGVAGDPNARSLSDQAVTLFRKPKVVEEVEQWLVEVDRSLITAGLRPGLVAYDAASGRIWTVKSVVSESALATASATVHSDGTIEGINLGRAGNGYEPGASVTVTVAAPEQIAARATATVNAEGKISEILVTARGQGYKPGDTPTVTIAMPGTNGTQATATAKFLENGTLEITLTDPGSRYPVNTAVQVTIDPPDSERQNEQATATASVDEDGRISEITLVNKGSGYWPTPPAITIAAPEVKANSSEVFALLELQDGGPWNPGDNFETWTAAIQFGTLMKLTEGSDVVTIPYGGVDFRNVFLGQEVSFSDLNAFGTNPTVRLLLHDQASFAASLNDSGVINTVELSEPASRSGWVFATFEVPDGRNDVAFNQTGIVLEGPAVRLVQTDVRESLGVGILIEDVQAWDKTKVSSIVAGQPIIEIGGQGVTAERTWGEPDDRNVAVFANRGAGIVFTQDVFEAVGKAILEDFDQAEDLSRKDRDELRSKFSEYVLIAGNYLGKDVSGAEELANGTGIVRNIGVGSLAGKAAAFASAIFSGVEGTNDVREDHDSDLNELEKERPLLPEDFVSMERYRALFRPEDFEASTDVFTFDPEIGELDPRTLLDRAKISDLESIRELDSLSNRHGTVPKYQAGDDNPDDPVGGGGSGNGSDDGDDGNDWWNDFPTLR